MDNNVDNIMNNEITIYGQDYSKIDDACASWSEMDENEVVVQRFDKLNKQPYYKNIDIRADLIEFLKGVEKKFQSNDTEDMIIIGHTIEKDDTSKDLQNRNWHIYNIYNGIDMFGSLVGIIRGSYYRDNVDSESSSEFDYPIVFKIIIYSRFDSSDIKNQVDQKTFNKIKPYFLASLLLKGNLKFDSIYNVNFDYETLFEFYLLWQFKKDLQNALFKGFFRKYQRFEKNDDRVRGSIDVSRHIRMNLGMDNGLIAYSYRENTVDNMVNHLILTAYDYLAEKYPVIVDENIDDILLGKLNNLRYEIDYPKYSLNEILVNNATPISHPYYDEFRKLQKTCLMILRDEAISPFGNADEEIDGILYYVPDLWEEYLSFYMEQKIDSLGICNTISMISQMEIPLMTSVNGTSDNDYMDETEEQKNKSYPDYVFLDRNNPYYILDAKYKLDWDKALYGKLKNREDYDKCIRDMMSVGGTGCGVIFPIKKDSIKDNIQIIHYFSPYNSFNLFYTFPVYIPMVQKESFKAWSKKMEYSLECSMKMIVNCLDWEKNRKEAYDRKLNEIINGAVKQGKESNDTPFKNDLSLLINIGSEWIKELKKNKKIEKDLN